MSLRYKLIIKGIVLLSLLGLLSSCGGAGSNPEPTIYAIGDTGPAGGIVFYITDGGLHGLEASREDQAIPAAPGAAWGCSEASIAGADGTAVGSGAQNTADILADCLETPIAADIADGYTLNGFSDWFLPSKDELHELYLQKDAVGGFSTSGSSYYWSSSEFNDVSTWFQDFYIVDYQNFYGKGSPIGVRAIRTF